MLFLVSINTDCWEEALNIFDNFENINLNSEEFTALISSLKKKITSKYIFFTFKPIKNTADVKFYYSNVNTIVTLFAKNMYFHSFRNLRLGQGNAQISNIIKN